MEFFTGHKLTAACLIVDLRPTQAGENQRGLPCNQMRAIELGGYVDGELTPPQGVLGVVGVRRRCDEIAPIPIKTLARPSCIA